MQIPLNVCSKQMTTQVLTDSVTKLSSFFYDQQLFFPPLVMDLKGIDGRARGEVHSYALIGLSLVSLACTFFYFCLCYYFIFFLKCVCQSLNSILLHASGFFLVFKQHIRFCQCLGIIVQFFIVISFPQCLNSNVPCVGYNNLAREGENQYEFILELECRDKTS